MQRVMVPLERPIMRVLQVMHWVMVPLLMLIMRLLLVMPMLSALQVISG